MKSFHTDIDIHAPAATCWRLLTDASTWTDWNPTVTHIEGTIALGEKVTVQTTLSPGRAFPVRVTTFEPPHAMVWTGGMPLGLFTGERRYELTEAPNGTTRFAMTETFRGPLLVLMGKSLPDMTDAFADFAAGLKRAAESD